MIRKDINSIGIFLLVSICWVVGAYELIDIFRNFTTQWYWYVLAILYTITINDIFVHNICAHSKVNINTNGITYKILVFLVSVDHGYAPLTTFCSMHAVHHGYADQKYDHINYKTNWYDLCILAPWIFLYNKNRTPLAHDKVFFENQVKRFQAINDDLWTFFCEQYSLPLTILYWGILYLICPIVLFKVVMLGRLLISMFNCLTDVFGHMKLPFGYRNFDLNDTSYNHLIFHYLSLGLFNAMLHNNHHGLRSLETCRFRWFEIYTGLYLNKFLRFLLEKK
jgi:fatty-acid desaturase